MNLTEKEVHWYRNDGSKLTPRRKALNRADEFDNRGQNERAKKIRSIVISKDHGDTYDARRKAKNIKVDDNKVGKLPVAAKSDKRGAIDVKHNLKKLKEEAPPTKKHERMVKHIKKAYKKDGKLTDDEKSIAYATAWKNYNKKEVKEASAVLDANTNIKKDEKKKKMEAELKRLLKHAIAVKKGHAESFEIDKTEHKKVQKQKKMRNLAIKNTNKNEGDVAHKKAGGPKLYGEEVSRRNKPSSIAKKKKLEKLLIDKEVNKVQKEETTMTYQEMIDAGWEMTGEGIWWPPQPNTITEKLTFPKFRKKAAKRKPQMDDTTKKLHQWRKDKEQEEREKYVTFTKPIEKD